MATLEINGKRVEVDDGFLDLPPEQQQATVEEIAASMDGGPLSVDNNSKLGFINKGIADAIDFVNPGENLGLHPPMAEIFRGDANPNRPDFLRIATADRDPETFLEGVAQGSGEGAATMAPIASMLGKVKPALGALATTRLGRFGQALVNSADDAARGLKTTSGAVIEPIAAGVSRGAPIEARKRGLPEWMAQTTGALAPIGLIPTVMAGQQTARAIGATGAFVGRQAAKLPGARAITGVTKAILPMTERGAHKIASERMVDLAGGPDRAVGVADKIKPNSGLTPAQQTGDANLLALERRAIAEDPNIGDAVAAMAQTFRADALEMLAKTQEGSPATTRKFFAARRKAFEDDMNARIEKAISEGDEALNEFGNPRAEEAVSTDVVERLTQARTQARLESSAKWSLVPDDASTGTENAIRVARDWQSKLSDAEQVDIPPDVKTYLLGNSQYAEGTTVQNLQGLASRLRRIARNSLAGPDPNPILARVANEVADAIYVDLDAVDPTTETGRLIKDAVEYTRTMYETSGQGAVGRMLQRNVSREATLPPAAALRSTVGAADPRGGPAVDKILTAAPTAEDDITEFLRGRFVAAALGGGKFNAGAATRWINKNVLTLKRIPGLEDEMRTALTSRNEADLFELKTRAMMKLAEQGPIAKFGVPDMDKSAYAILKADDPVAAANSLVNAAGKDETGASLAGLKASVADNLIVNSLDKEGILKGGKFLTLLGKPHYSQALLKVFSPDEMARMLTVARQSAALDKAESSKALSAIIDAPSNMMTSLLARVAGARAGSAAGAGPGMGGSLQSAGIFAGLARKTLHNITNRRAREILKESITDPELFKYLLDPKYGSAEWIDLPKPVQNKLAPYIMGSVVEQGGEAVRNSGIMDFLKDRNEGSGIMDFLGAN